MKEKQLNFKTNEDSTLVLLSEKSKEELLKEINSLGFTTHELGVRIKDNSLEEGFKETLVSLLESYVVRIFKELNFDSVLAKEREVRYSEVRSLNDENRQLRKELGDKVSLEDLREKIKNLETNIKTWWNIEGFGYTSKIDFKGYGIEILFSGMLTDTYYGKKEPSKKTDKVIILKEKGFEIDNYEVLDTDVNKDLLLKLIQKQYPSGEIIEIKTHRGRNSHKSGQIRDIKVWLSDYNEINYVESE